MIKKRTLASALLAATLSVGFTGCGALTPNIDTYNIKETPKNVFINKLPKLNPFNNKPLFDISKYDFSTKIEELSGFEKFHHYKSLGHDVKYYKGVNALIRNGNYVVQYQKGKRSSSYGPVFSSVEYTINTNIKGNKVYFSLDPKVVTDTRSSMVGKNLNHLSTFDKLDADIKNIVRKLNTIKIELKDVELFASESVDSKNNPNTVFANFLRKIGDPTKKGPVVNTDTKKSAYFRSGDLNRENYVYMETLPYRDGSKNYYMLRTTFNVNSDGVPDITKEDIETFKKAIRETINE